MRARLRHVALTRMPLWLSRGRLAHHRPERVHLTRHALVLPQLPPALSGLRIAHLSDLHIGRLVTPLHLPHIVEAANRLESDLVAITGDFVDLDLHVLDELIAALQRLRAPLGVYLVLGNHDYLIDGPQLIRRFRHAGLQLLVNQNVVLAHGGCRITVAGIDYAHESEHLSRLVRQTLRHSPARNGADLRLLLAHHPDAFDCAGSHAVDLTLSGHTHGGQLVLRNGRGKKGLIGLGSLAFQYPRGLYRRGQCYLHVTTGIGSWFPWRVNCPAEIALLTLLDSPSQSRKSSHP